MLPTFGGKCVKIQTPRAEISSDSAEISFSCDLITRKCSGRLTRKRQDDRRSQDSTGHLFDDLGGAGRNSRLRSRFSTLLSVSAQGCFFAARSRTSFADNPAALGTNSRAAGLRPLVGRCVYACTRMASVGGSNSRPITPPLTRPPTAWCRLRSACHCHPSRFARSLVGALQHGWEVRGVATAGFAYRAEHLRQESAPEIRAR